MREQGYSHISKQRRRPKYNVWYGEPIEIGLYPLNIQNPPSPSPLDECFVLGVSVQKVSLCCRVVQTVSKALNLICLGGAQSDFGLSGGFMYKFSACLGC